VVILDPTLTKSVQKELTELQHKVAKENQRESERWKGKQLFGV